jgi:hypothetical protein
MACSPISLACLSLEKKIKSIVITTALPLTLIDWLLLSLCAFGLSSLFQISIYITLVVCAAAYFTFIIAAAYAWIVVPFSNFYVHYYARLCCCVFHIDYRGCVVIVVAAACLNFLICIIALVCVAVYFK